MLMPIVIALGVGPLLRGLMASARLADKGLEGLAGTKGSKAEGNKEEDEELMIVTVALCLTGKERQEFEANPLFKKARDLADNAKAAGQVPLCDHCGGVNA